MSFDMRLKWKSSVKSCLNPFGTGQCLSTYEELMNMPGTHRSQSLWNRAMSFDKNKDLNMERLERLNPFGTGQCLSTKL